MVRQLKKIGNSKGLILDPAIIEQMQIDVGDEVELTMHSTGSLTITPVKERFIPDEEATKVFDEIIAENDELFKRLA